MGLEIERKFLVRTDLWKPGEVFTSIVQGYLCRTADKTVRIRIETNDFLQASKSVLTVKGRTVGISREEIETPLDLRDARELLDRMCPTPHIHKRRYVEDVGDGLAWEIDAFGGRLKGLVLAEIELDYEDQEFDHPEWLGKEVTGDKRFYNSSLSLALADGDLSRNTAFVEELMAWQPSSASYRTAHPSHPS